MITRVSGRNIKGRTFAHDLAPITVITGPNYSGKSAILEAIRLAVAGYSPDVSKTNSGIWEMAGEGREMAVAVTTDRETFHRRWWLERGSVKSEGTEPRKLVSLDPDIYFSLSSAKRVEYILANATIPDRFGTDAIVADLERLSLGEAHSEEAEKAKRQQISIVRDALDDAPNPSEGLEAVVNYLRDTLKETNARMKGAREAMRALVAMKHGDTVSGTPESARADVDRIQRELDAARSDYLRRVRASEEYEVAVRRRKSLKEALEAPGRDYAADETRVRKQLEALEPGEVTPLAELEDELDAAATKAQELLKAYESRKGELDRAEREIGELESEKACPHCGSAGKGWKERLMANLVAQRDAIRVPNLADSEVASEMASKIRAKLDTARTRNETVRRTDAEIHRLKAELALIGDSRKAEDARRREIADRLSESEPTAPDESKLGPLWDAIEALEAKKSIAQEAEREAVRHQQDRKRAAEAEETVTQCETAAAVLKLFGTSLAEKRKELASEVLTPIVATANTVAGCILRTPLEYRDGEIGRQEGGTWISHRTFSGAEKAVTYAAVSVAVSMDGDFRVLMLDEASRLTPELQGRFLEGVSEAIYKGMLDQAILVSPVAMSNPGLVEVAEIVVGNASDQGRAGVDAGSEKNL